MARGEGWTFRIADAVAKACDVDLDTPWKKLTKKKQEMVQRSNGRMTVPQIFIGDRHIGGCDDLFELESTGELDELLAA